MKKFHFVCLAAAGAFLLGFAADAKESKSADEFVYEGSTRTAPIVTEPVALPDPDYKSDYDGTNAFVILGADLSSDVVTHGNFITAEANAKFEGRSLDLDGIVFPYVKAIQTTHRRVLQALAPNVTTYLINGKSATKTEFDSIPAPMFEAVEIVGDTLKLKTRKSINSRNHTFWKLQEEDRELYLEKHGIFE